MRDETEKLLKQAEYELKVAKALCGIRHYSAASFHTQQAAEMALKALHVERLGQLNKKNDLVYLGKTVRAPPNMLTAASLLGPLYQTARHAHVRDDGAPPAEAFTQEDADDTVNAAGEVFGWVESQLKN